VIGNISLRWWWLMFYGNFCAHSYLNERPPKAMKRSQRWNTLQIWPPRDSNSGDSDLWSNALSTRPRRHNPMKLNWFTYGLSFGRTVIDLRERFRLQILPRKWQIVFVHHKWRRKLRVKSTSVKYGLGGCADISYQQPHNQTIYQSLRYSYQIWVVWLTAAEKDLLVYARLYCHLSNTLTNDTTNGVLVVLLTLYKTNNS